jgi:hypothetical protein
MEKCVEKIQRTFSSLSFNDVLRLRTLWAVNDGELYPLSLFQGTIAGSINLTVVDENVFVVSALNKTKALGRIEPLYSANFAFCHDSATSFVLYWLCEWFKINFRLTSSLDRNYCKLKKT